MNRIRLAQDGVLANTVTDFRVLQNVENFLSGWAFSGRPRLRGLLSSLTDVIANDRQGVSAITKQSSISSPFLGRRRGIMFCGVPPEKGSGEKWPARHRVRCWKHSSHQSRSRN
jgi:hypothetical protein